MTSYVNEARQALERAARLEEMGVEIRSLELSEEAKRLTEFFERGGNRAMRRAAERSLRRPGK